MKISSGYIYYLNNFVQVLGNKHFKGWGRKKTGKFALWCYKKFGGKLTLYEDGFIRSIGLGVNGSPSWSIVEDDVGIYYDARTPSKLENILNTYDFKADVALMELASKAIDLMVEHNISKYNSAPLMRDAMNEKRVLIIAQTAGDASLEYGMLNSFSTDEMIADAKRQYPDSSIYLKVHPDVLSGKKCSDIDIEEAKKSCVIIEENINPLSLLKHFNTVYTKTSQMGFEALLVGCECVCFGMPFYAGWGITTDKSICGRRERILSVEEVFAAAYILYTRYYNPYKNIKSDILDTIKEIKGLK